MYFDLPVENKKLLQLMAFGVHAETNDGHHDPGILLAVEHGQDHLLDGIYFKLYHTPRRSAHERHRAKGIEEENATSNTQKDSILLSRPNREGPRHLVVVALQVLTDFILRRRCALVVGEQYWDRAEGPRQWLEETFVRSRPERRVLPYPYTQSPPEQTRESKTLGKCIRL